MVALYRSGRQAEALDAYQNARTALTEELGIEPARDLRELQQGILNQDPELDLRPTADTAAEDPSRGVFVGREHELDELAGALGDALAGRGRLVLLAGEPGIGKSRLADELMGQARTRGARILVGRCWEAGGAPAYWPWVQSLRAYVRESEPEALRAQLGREGADFATMLPEVRDLLPDLPVSQAADSEGARFHLLESVAAFLRNAASSGPLALFLDDLTCCRRPSLLLLFVAGQLAGSPILIVGCYRHTEVGPDLADALADLTREPAVRRLTLTGPSGSDTSRLLELTMGEGLADELAARVQAETQGTRSSRPRLRGCSSRKVPVGKAEGGLPIPEGVREAIGRRLRRQSEPCREILALASVKGREPDLEVIGRVSELEEDELLRARRGGLPHGWRMASPRQAGGCASRTSWSGMRSTRICQHRDGCACIGRLRRRSRRSMRETRSRTWPSLRITT